MKEMKKEKKDYYSKVACGQLILCFLLLLAVFFLKSEGMKEDYRRIMSYTVTKDDFTAIVASVRDYFASESSFREVFLKSEITEEAETEETTEEETETTDSSEETTESDYEEEISPMGGADISKSEVPSNCTFAPLKLTAPILNPIEKGRYTSYFGFRTNPITGEYSFHTGLDIAQKEGTRIRAALNGTVTKIGEDSRAGKYIFLTHQKGLQTFYCHCSEILAEEGANIRQGETIALVGTTGMSTGPHLHFEVRKDNIRYNPLPLLENAD